MSGTINDVERTLNEISDNTTDYLLVEKGWELYTEPSSFQLYARDLFYTYFPIEPYRNGNLVYSPLVNFIRDNYEIIHCCGNLQVLRRKPDYV